MKIKNNDADNEIFEKLENRIIDSNLDHLSDLIYEVANGSAGILFKNLDKVFANVAYKMFAQNNIDLNYDVCTDINKLLVDLDVTNPDYDVCSVTDKIESLIVYYKNIDMCKQLENKIINCESKCLGDLIDEVAKDNVDFYTDDLFESLKALYHDGYYDKAISEPNSGNDILEDIRKAQYFANKDILFESQERILINVACKRFSDAGIVVDSNIKYNIIDEGMKCITFSLDGTTCLDDDGMIDIYDSIDVVFDIIDKLIDEYKGADHR